MPGQGIPLMFQFLEKEQRDNSSDVFSDHFRDRISCFLQISSLSRRPIQELPSIGSSLLSQRRKKIKCPILVIKKGALSFAIN